MTHKEIQAEVIAKYNIILCDGTMCDGTKCPHAWRRTHSCRMERKIYKWEFKNSIRATFSLLHEIGHQETRKPKMRRAESEYHATMWAIEECKKYGLVVPEEIRKLYQDYINREKDRGLRRGGSGYGNLELKW